MCWGNTVYHHQCLLKTQRASVRSQHWWASLMPDVWGFNNHTSQHRDWVVTASMCCEKHCMPDNLLASKLSGVFAMYFTPAADKNCWLPGLVLSLVRPSLAQLLYSAQQRFSSAVLTPTTIFHSLRSAALHETRSSSSHDEAWSKYF